VAPVATAPNPQPTLAAVAAADSTKHDNRGKGKSRNKQGLDTPTDIWDDYTSGEEDAPKGAGGVKMDPRLKEISLPCYCKDDTGCKCKLARCLGMKKGCSQTYAWPQQKARISAHAADCSYLAEMENMADIIEGINLSMGTEAPSVKLANMKRKNREPLDVAAPKKPRIDQEIGI
jgi:hypothetical protein